MKKPKPAVVAVWVLGILTFPFSLPFLFVWKVICASNAQDKDGMPITPARMWAENQRREYEKNHPEMEKKGKM